jgi:preprotein translocase subunit Sec61beta
MSLGNGDGLFITQQPEIKERREMFAAAAITGLLTYYGETETERLIKTAFVIANEAVKESDSYD